LSKTLLSGPERLNGHGRGTYRFSDEFMKILVAYDGSKSAREALRTAVTHAKAFGARIYLVTSLFGDHGDSRAEVDKVEKELENAELLVTKEGIPCERHLLIRARQPGEDIVQFARENHIDQIVAGVKRRSKVGKMVFGSNAQYIVLNAPCPVVTVK
jgi:nucleotide-binding universal stress UspA family protein